MLKICKIVFLSSFALTVLFLIAGYILEQKSMIDREVGGHYARLLAFSLMIVLAFSGLPFVVTRFFQVALQLNINVVTQFEPYSTQIVYGIWAIWALGLAVILTSAR